MADGNDLAQLKAQVTVLSDNVTALKEASPADKTAIAAAVQELLAAKKQYADQNNGIGVDGKPYQEPLTNAQKKAKAKAEKAAAATEGDPNSVNAQKKAAKKADKKDKKAAYKQGAAGDQVAAAKPAAPTASGGSAKPAASAAASNNNNNKPAAAVVASTNTSPLVTAAASGPKLAPLQVAMNPNVPLTQRPVVALSVAVLTDTDVDLELVSDHKCRHTSMGLTVNNDDGGGAVVTGDFAMARYLCRRAAGSSSSSSRRTCTSSWSLLPDQPAAAALVDSWIDYAQSLAKLDLPQRLMAVTLTVEHALHTNNTTFVLGDTMTLADLCLFAIGMDFCTQAAERRAILAHMPAAAMHTRRWLEVLAHHPALQQATQLCVGIANNAEAVFDEQRHATTLEPLVSGMNALQGAVPGRVVTRFPPEPSGYLHIGHAKAVLLNDYYARRYQGRLIVRFDDTNPSKEKEEYQESIVQDLSKLGVKPDLISFTSDYFSAIQDYAKQLIAAGMAYMDDTPQEQMQAERADRVPSKHRDTQTPAQALELFELMCSGQPEGSKWCLRAKIDMASDNGTMRDPVVFRQNVEPHHRCGTKYKAFPTYDLACPIVDSLEGVTHCLRTTEYNDRDEQYQWLLKAMGLRRVRIHAFSRVNFKYTVLSKRKLTWFVDNNYVTGWDDPRMPTVRGVVRRGINIAALRNFMYSQGASRRIVLMDWTVFWSENKKELDKTAKRFMAIDKETHVHLTVTNAPKANDNAFVQTSLHPKDASMGMRAVRISSEALLEKVDVEGITVGETIVLMRWGVVKVTKVDDGEQHIEGEFIPNGDFKAAKRKLSWIANVPASHARVILTEFDNLVSKDKLEEEDNFMDFINPNTLATTEVIGDAGLKNLHEHEVIQLERRGFFRVDRPFINNDKPLILYMIPDGKSKVMSGMVGKLAHR